MCRERSDDRREQHKLWRIRAVFILRIQNSFDPENLLTMKHKNDGKEKFCFFRKRKGKQPTAKDVDPEHRSSTEWSRDEAERQAESIPERPFLTPHSHGPRVMPSTESIPERRFLTNHSVGQVAVMEKLVYLSDDSSPTTAGGWAGPIRPLWLVGAEERLLVTCP